MKTHSPQHPEGHKRHRDTEKTKPFRDTFRSVCAASIFSVFLCFCGWGFALQVSAEPLPGRLFYTPAQRAMLVNAREHKITELQKSEAPSASAPVSFDGVIQRSDGVETRWINGRPHVGRAPAVIRDLKPGQTRAAEKVYEPYQLLRPAEPLAAPAPAGASAPQQDPTAQ